MYCTRNSSKDEIANVSFLYDDIVYVLQNTIHVCINSVADRRGYVLERMFTKFSEITQYNGHYAIQGQSRSFKVTDFGTNRKLICDFLLVINTNLPPIFTVSKLWLIIRQIFASERECLTLSLSPAVIPCQYRHK